MSDTTKLDHQKNVTMDIRLRKKIHQQKHSMSIDQQQHECEQRQRVIDDMESYPERICIFNHKGVKCMLARNHFNAWCGYIFMPVVIAKSDHPPSGGRASPTVDTAKSASQNMEVIVRFNDARLPNDEVQPSSRPFDIQISSLFDGQAVRMFEFIDIQKSYPITLLDESELSSIFHEEITYDIYERERTTLSNVYRIIGFDCSHFHDYQPKSSDPIQKDCVYVDYVEARGRVERMAEKFVEEIEVKK